MKISIAWTDLSAGWLTWYREEGYLSVGVGPLFLQFEWQDEGRI